MEFLIPGAHVLGIFLVPVYAGRITSSVNIMGFNPFSEISELERGKDYIHPAVKNAHRIAEKMLKENAVDPKDFTALYGTENIARDIAYAEKREREFSRDAHKVYAEVLEAILYDQIELSDWFGANARTIKTSFFDDIVNGSDLILELEDIKKTFSHLSLSVDVTFGTSTETKKFSAIKDKIDAGTLGTIKYFHSEKGGFRDELSKVPQVVIGVEKDMVIQLSGLWAGEHGRNREGNLKLATHPVQRIIFTEILLELRAFKEYAEATGKNALVPIYEKDILALEDILRKRPLMDMGDLRNDRVFAAIRSALLMFKAP